MQARGTLAKLIWLSVLLLLSLQCIGCVALQCSSPNSVPIVTRCGHQTNRYDPFDSCECCEMYDQSEIGEGIVSRMRPFGAWTSERCGVIKTTAFGWANRCKAEANAPPWPRFHPVPTKPVFEPEQVDEEVSPEVYGRFGKG